jgi:hypothetical protein
MTPAVQQQPAGVSSFICQAVRFSGFFRTDSQPASMVLIRRMVPCVAGILGTRPRRCSRRQAGARKGAGPGRQAHDITHPSERPGDSMTAIAQGEAPHLGIFWLAQTSNARRRLPAGRAIRRLPNLRPWPSRNMGSLTSRQDYQIPPCAPWCGHTTTRTGRVDALSSTGRAICSSFTRIASS